MFAKNYGKRETSSFVWHHGDLHTKSKYEAMWSKLRFKATGTRNTSALPKAFLDFYKEVNLVKVVCDDHPCAHAPDIHREFLSVRHGIEGPIERKERMQDLVATVDKDGVHACWMEDWEKK